jgi:hypothetical protein
VALAHDPRCASSEHRVKTVFMDSSQCGDEDVELLSGDEVPPHARDGADGMELEAWAALGARLADLAPSVLISVLDALELAVASGAGIANEFANTYETYN